MLNKAKVPRGRAKIQSNKETNTAACIILRNYIRTFFKRSISLIKQFFSLAFLCASVGVVGAAMAEEPLVMFEEGRTLLDCEFANHALSSGYFGKIDNPTITGRCPEATLPAASKPVVGSPVVPFVPPIAPWCDCTDEQLQAMLSLMAQEKVLINPGYESADPAADWAKAFGTDMPTIKSPDFWANGQVPAFNELSNRRFLELE